jgi:hypothetical protein
LRNTEAMGALARHEKQEYRSLLRNTLAGDRNVHEILTTSTEMFMLCLPRWL